MPSSGWQQEIEAPCLCPTLLTTLPTLLLLLLLQGSTSLPLFLLLLQGSSVSTVSYSSASTHGSDDTLDRDHQGGGGQGGGGQGGQGGLVARIRRLSGIRRQDRDTRPRY